MLLLLLLFVHSLYFFYMTINGLNFAIFSHQVVSLTRRRMKFMVSAMGALPHESDVIHYNQCKAKCHNNSNHYQIIQQMYLLRSKGKSHDEINDFFLLSFILCLYRKCIIDQKKNVSCSDGIKRFHDHTLRLIHLYEFVTHNEILFSPKHILILN